MVNIAVINKGFQSISLNAFKHMLRHEVLKLRWEPVKAKGSSHRDDNAIRGAGCHKQPSPSGELQLVIPLVEVQVIIQITSSQPLHRLFLVLHRVSGFLCALVDLFQVHTDAPYIGALLWLLCCHNW